MARIGAFGSTLFEVSSYKILTFDNYNRKTAATFAEHKILNKKARLEFTGIQPTEISMTILLHKDLNVEVNSELKKLRQMCENGEANYLIVGAEVIGNSLFVIEELSEEVLHWSGTATPIVVKCQLKFKEYK